MPEEIPVLIAVTEDKCTYGQNKPRKPTQFICMLLWEMLLKLLSRGGIHTTVFFSVHDKCFIVSTWFHHRGV